MDTKDTTDPVAAPFGELAEHMGNAPIAPAHGIAAIALSMAMKYHAINTVQDGTLYQQYKLEGRNMRSLNLNDVFETAIQMEMHLMGAGGRISKLIVDVFEAVIEEDASTDTDEQDGAKD